MKKAKKTKALLCGLTLSLCLGAGSLAACGSEEELPDLPDMNYACSHVWFGETVVKEATCTEDGELTKTCMSCGEVQKEVIPAGHKYDGDMQSDEEFHWSGACLVCGQGQEKAPHDWIWTHDEETHLQQCYFCDRIGADGPHTGSEVYETTSEYHYHYCDICENEYSMGQHNFVHNTCSDCGYTYLSTGLSYRLNEGGTGYVVTGIGSETGPVVAIPAKHEGLPVVSIDPNAFNGNADIKTLIIPASVTRIDGDAFFFCSSLKKVIYRGTVEDWIKIQFVGSSSNPLANSAELVANGELVEEITLQDVGYVSDWFMGCTSLKSITIPSSVSEIAPSAFEGCTSLETVNISNATKIGENAFNGCTKLSEFVIPSNVTSIGDNAFADCSSLKSVKFAGNKVKSIGKEAFVNCSSLESISIPQSVETIGTMAFANCKGLKVATFNTNSSIVTIPQKLFSNCTSLKNVTLSAQIAAIEESAFNGCSNLTSIVMPTSLSLIQLDAFKDCSSVKEVHFNANNVSKWFNIEFKNKQSNPLNAGADLYNNGNKVTEISVNISGIKDYSLINCTSIEKIKATSTLTTIGVEAMSGCINLKSLETANSSLRTISTSAFYGCYNLEAIDWSDDLSSIGETAFYGCSKLTEISLAQADMLKAIARSAFEGCYSVTEVSLPQSLETIEKDAFKNCSQVESVFYTSTQNDWIQISFVNEESNPMHRGADLYFDGALVENITLERSGANSIVKANTFVGCLSLKTVSILDSISAIEFGAFKGCDNINKMNIAFVGAEKDANLNGHFGYIFGASNAAANKDFVPSRLQTIVISEGVTKISNGAFSGCSSINELFVPTSIRTFEANAFAGTGINSVYYFDEMVGGNDAWASKKFASENANPLHTGAKLYDVSNNEITSIHIGSNASIINDYAFAGSLITSVTCADDTTLSRIGKGAFKNCNELTDIAVPFIGESENSSYKYFGYIFGASNAENNASTVPTSLKTVTLYNFDGVNENAFRSCRWIEELYIEFEDSATQYTFGRDAFFGCSSISRVIFNDTNWAKHQFKNRYANPMNTTGVSLLRGFNALNPVTTVDSDVVNDFAFLGCESIENVNITGATVGESAFEGCHSIDNVTFNAVASVGENAFKDCSSVDRVDFNNGGDELEGWFAMEFEGSEANPLINGVPLYFDGSLVTSLDLRTLDIETLKSNVIAGCTSLTSVTIAGNTTSVERGALYGCKNITDVTVAYLGGSATDSQNAYLGYVFGANSADENRIYVPSSIRKVGIMTCEEITASAFKDVSGIKELVLPANKITFRSGAFSGCAINTVKFTSQDATTTYQDNLMKWVENDFESLDANPLHKGAVLYISDVGVDKAVNIIDNADITEIKPYAFAGCKSLTSVNVTENLKTVGEYAFSGCVALQTVENFNKLEEVGFSALGDTIINGLAVSYTGSSDGAYTHFGYIFGAQDYTENNAKVPTSLKEIVYTGNNAVAENAFNGCKNIQEVSFIKGLTSIGDSAFSGCESLNKVLFASDCELKSIGVNAFASCESLKAMNIPSTLEMTGNGAFSGCTSLEAVAFIGESINDWIAIRFGRSGNPLTNGAKLYIGENATLVEDVVIELTDTDYISAYAFDGCSSIKTVTLKGVKHIGDNAFENCQNLVTVTFSDDKLNSIGNDAFSGCVTLDSINLEDTKVVSIGKQAFSKCVSLKEIVIPETVQNMGKNVFDSTEGLTVKVDLASRPSNWQDLWAEGVNKVLWKGQF